MVLLPPHVPHPSVSVNGSPVPMPQQPCADGTFTSTRLAGIFVGEPLHPLGVLRVDVGGVARALVVEQRLAERHRLVVAVDGEERQHRRKALACLRALRTCRVGLEDDQPRARLLEPGLLGEPLGRLPDEPHLEVAVGLEGARDELVGLRLRRARPRPVPRASVRNSSATDASTTRCCSEPQITP